MSRERDALRALAYVRSEGLSLTRAARRVGLTRKEALEVISPYVFKSRGRWVATEWDRRPREMRFIDNKGLKSVTVKDSRTATKVGLYMNAVDEYLRTGDDFRLRMFAGRTFQSDGETYEFITNRELLKRLGNAGEIQFEEIYQLTGRQA